MRLLVMLAVLFVAATVLMGTAVTVLLAIGMGEGRDLLIAALGGLIVSVPVSWLVTVKITGPGKP